MKKKIKSQIIIVGIILIVLILLFIPTKKPQTNGVEIIKCIGERATLYIQLGCSHCKTQEALFGENYEFINSVDCFYENDKCGGIRGTPSWRIGSKIVIGVQTIEELRELTGC